MNDQRKVIFDQLRILLCKYESPFVAKSDFDSRYELASPKEVVIAGRTKKEVCFASIIIQSNYVGFYFMPIYADKKVEKSIGKELTALLKGKTCFHIRTLDENLIGQIEKALKVGFDFYKEKGWV